MLLLVMSLSYTSDASFSEEFVLYSKNWFIEEFLWYSVLSWF